MGKRCFYTLSAIFAGFALIASEGDAVVIRSATSCFKIPAKQKLNVKTAIARFEAEALRGNVDAKAHLGLFYLRGLGVKKDAAQAWRYFKESTARGNALGDFGYGYCLYAGIGVRKDYRAAVAPLERAVAAGNSDAMLLLFNIRRNGWAGKTDLAEALSLLRRAVASGNAAAVYR